MRKVWNDASRRQKSTQRVLTLYDVEMQERAGYFILYLIMNSVNFFIHGYFLGMQIFGGNFVDLLKTLSSTLIASCFYVVVRKRYKQIKATGRATVGGLQEAGSSPV